MQRAIFEIVSGFDSQGEWFVNCYRKTTKGTCIRVSYAAVACPYEVVRFQS